MLRIEPKLSGFRSKKYSGMVPDMFSGIPSDSDLVSLSSEELLDISHEMPEDPPWCKLIAELQDLLNGSCPHQSAQPDNAQL